MKIDGHEIPAAVLARARQWSASQTDGFTAAQLESLGLSLGIDPARTMRFADRMIQTLKKAEEIRLEGKPRRWYPNRPAQKESEV